MAKTLVKKHRNDQPHYFRDLGIIKHGHFLELNEVGLEDLERWHRDSLPVEKTRIRPNERHKPIPNPMGFVDTARHHTTKGRSKQERIIDRYWFVPIGNKTDYNELAYSKAIAPRRTTIYPPFLPKGRPEPKQKTEKSCQRCGGPFDAKRKDARFCSPKCQKAAKRGFVRDKSRKAT